MRHAERCAGQRHFLGYDAADEGGGAAEDETGEGGGGAANHRSPYLLRQLMGFCMFHGCNEVALLGEADLAAHGIDTRVMTVGGASRNITLFV